MKTHATPPAATVARKNTAIISSVMAASASASIRRITGVGRIERRGKPLFLAVVTRTVPEARPPDSGRTMLADQLAVGVLADQVVEEDVLGNDDVAFHSHDFGDVRDLA